MIASPLLFLLFLLQTPVEGVRVQVGSEPLWKNTVAAAAAGGMLYTVDSQGSLWRTDRLGERVQIGKTGEWMAVSMATHSESIACVLRRKTLTALNLEDGTVDFGAGSWPEASAMAAVGEDFYLVDKTGAVHVQNVGKPPSFTNVRRQVASSGSWSGTVLAVGWKNRIWSIDDKGCLYRSTDSFGREKVGDAPHWAGSRWMGATVDALVTLDRNGSLFKTDEKGKRLQVGGVGHCGDTAACAILRGDLWTVSSAGHLIRTTLLSPSESLAAAGEAALTLAQLRSLAERCLKTVTNSNDETAFWISAPRPAKSPVNVNFQLSKDRSYIWLSAHFGKASAGQLKQSADFLRANDGIRPCQYHVTDQGELVLSLPVDNRGVTSAVLRENFNHFLQCATDTEHLWNPPAAKK